MQVPLTIQQQLSVPITSCFISIQGEGPEAGRPAFFLRLAGCSMKCVWCDSDYTFKKEKLIMTMYTLDSLIQKIKEMISQFKHNRLICVITGGEPIDKPYLGKIVKSLRNIFNFISLETSGYKVFQYDIFDSISLSIKLSSSGIPEHKRICPSVILDGCKLPHTFFKFVVDTQQDWEEVLQLKQHFNIPEEKIWIMPCCRTREEYISKSQWLVPKCIDEGLRFCSREQIAIWSDEKDR